MKTPIDEKLEKQDFDLFSALDAIDNKDYSWYSNLSDEQKKKFTPYMLLHWCSSIKGNKLLSKYYLMSVEFNANKHIFNEKVQNHPELQWMMLCASSPGMGKQFHQYIPNLSSKIGQLKTLAKKKEVQDYFEKVYKNSSKNDLQEASNEFVKDQNHKYRLATMFPSMKLEDIEILSTCVSSDEINEYERRSGN